jgi:hypothetical protein
MAVNAGNLSVGVNFGVSGQQLARKRFQQLQRRAQVMDFRHNEHLLL